MSKEHAANFYEEMKSNPQLKNTVRTIQENMVHIAKSHGYDFTYDELMEHLEERWGADFEADNPNPDDPQTCCCV